MVGLLYPAMRYIIRADASLETGSGHVMRSSALGEELIARGCEVIFIGLVTSLPWVHTRIINLGFSQILLSQDEFHPNPMTDILILDSYSLPTNDPFLARSNWNKIVCIADDVTPVYECDLVVHPGIESGWQGNFQAIILSGTKFVPFRTSIKKSRKLLKRTEILEILVVGGGVDAYGFVKAIGDSLKGLNSDFKANLISGNIDPLDYDSRFCVSTPGEILDKFSLSADLVFTTASTTCLEFIARGIAVGIGCAVENQEQYYKSLPKHDVAAPIGKYTSGSWAIDKILIRKLVESDEFRERLRSNGNKLIDLKGTKRIIDKLQQL